MHGPLFQVFVYLAAAVVSVPVAKRLGLGSVLGYLIAGALVGPSVLSLVNAETGADHAEHVGEFGVVVMLFLIGLELRPARLWEMRGSVLGLGGLQVALTAATVGLVALGFGNGWRTGLAAGLILAMSSTAIVLQSLGEKGQLKTPGGAACFSVLLFQDLAVIPILAVLPLLAAGGASVHAREPGALPPWAQGLVTLGAVGVVVVGGRYALRPLFRWVARTDLREMFTATALGLVVGIALLMQAVGLSAALGTFLAGVVLADSEYRHQLEADLEPFKGLLLGLFFISVGAGINFAFCRAHPGLMLALVGGLLLLKFAVLYGLGRAFRLGVDDRLLFAFGLAQGGEFAFVLISFCLAGGVLAAPAGDALTAAVALSMAAAPLLLVANDRLARRRSARRNAGLSTGPEREADAVDAHDQGGVILAGFGRLGGVVGRLLQINDVPVTVLEHDSDWVDTLREFGLKAYYGDALREDLLLSAGVRQARLFIITLGDQEQSLKLVDLLQADFPHLTIIAAANDRRPAYELIRRGLVPANIYRETLGTSLDMSVGALRRMGFRGTQADRAAKLFRTQDDAVLAAMSKVYDGDREVYVSTARQHIQNLENLLREDARRQGGDHAADRGWEGAPRAGRVEDGEEEDAGGLLGST